jgi:preprotein translocase subunit SecE
MKGIKKFFGEVRKELSKVKWPSKKDMVKYSIATIVFVIFFAAFFYLIGVLVALITKLV